MEKFIPGEKRHTGQITIKRYCEKFGINMDFDLIFSAYVKGVNEETVYLTHINPYQTKKILQKEGQFLLYVSKNKDTFVLRASVEEILPDKVVAKIQTSQIFKDKRRFHRFHFCCKDLGDFIIQKDGRILCENACIYEMSRSGLGVINPCANQFKKGEILQIVNPQENIEFTYKIFHIQNQNAFQVLGGEIVQANINLINYVINKYIKVAEEIIY